MSSISLKPFEYFEPKTVQEAVNLLHSHGEKARVLAGGVDLLPRLRSGSTQADYLVNIQKIQELDYAQSVKKGGFEFGAMASLHSLELSPELKSDYPALWNAIHQITSVQTKCMGTVVGNLCVATPASDIAPTLAVLDAKLLVFGKNGEKTIPVADFYLDYQRTSLETGEMVTGVRLPATSPNSGVAFLNLVRTHADIAKVTVSAMITLEKVRCVKARIAVGSAAPTMFRAKKAESIFEGNVLTNELIEKGAEIAASEARPIDDIRSTAEYRREMVKVLVFRAINKALNRALGTFGKEQI